jgi:hypothetical protein
MNMSDIVRTVLLTAIIGIALFVIGGTGLAFWTYFHSDDPTSKTEWSVLQAVEQSDHQGTIAVGVAMDHHDFESVRYVVLRTKFTDASTPVWLLLNPEAEPLLKQIPLGAKVEIFCADLDRIEVQERIHPVVKSFLRRQCK